MTVAFLLVNFFLKENSDWLGNSWLTNNVIHTITTSLLGSGSVFAMDDVLHSVKILLNKKTWRKNLGNLCAWFVISVAVLEQVASFFVPCTPFFFVYPTWLFFFSLDFPFVLVFPFSSCVALTMFLRFSSREHLSSLMSEFVEDVKSGNHRSKGWPNTCYGMSKLGLIAYTNVRKINN